MSYRGSHKDNHGVWHRNRSGFRGRTQRKKSSKTEPHSTFDAQGFQIRYMDKLIGGDGRGNGYSGMNWYAALAIFGKDHNKVFPYSQDTVLVREGNSSALAEHEIREARKLKAIYDEKGSLMLEDYYAVHAMVLFEMGETSPSELANELPMVRAKVKELLKAQTD